MDYLLKLCVSILIICVCINKIDSATEDRTCHYCRESDDGPCHKNGNNVKTVRCDTLLYSRSTNYELFNDGGADGNTGGYRGGNDNGELEPRNGGRPPLQGARFQCVKERRTYDKDDRSVLLRTCVLDNFAATYCSAVGTMGETAIYDKFKLRECHICDGDNCNFGHSLNISFGLIAFVFALLITKSV